MDENPYKSPETDISDAPPGREPRFVPEDWYQWGYVATWIHVLLVPSMIAVYALVRWLR